MTLKFTDLSKRLQEAKDDTVVFAFGRVQSYDYRSCKTNEES